MNVNYVDAAFFILIVKKRRKLYYKNNKIHSAALASSGGFWVICTSHVYQRLIPTQSDLDGLLHCTRALPDNVIKSNDAHIELRAGVCTPGDTLLVFPQLKVKLVPLNLCFFIEQHSLLLDQSGEKMLILIQ